MPIMPMTTENIKAKVLEAVARGWTHPETEDKEMDSVLAVCIAAEIIELIHPLLDALLRYDENCNVICHPLLDYWFPSSVSIEEIDRMHEEYVKRFDSLNKRLADS